MTSPEECTGPVPCGSPREERELLLRVHGEFREMPGLKLTVREAARLFSMDPRCCERVLSALVRAGHLATDGKAFARVGDGRRFA